MNMYYIVVEWGDDAYRKLGREKIVDKFELMKPLDGFSYDGGRLDITGVDRTIWVSGSSFSVRDATREEYEDAMVDGE
jgi:hypothetical protein